MLKTDFWLYMIKLFLVSLGIYLCFRFLLPLFLPFLFAYIMIYCLDPVMIFAKTKWHIPKPLARYGILTVSLAGILSLIFLIIWKVMDQIRLFLSNFPLYKQALSKLCYDHFHNLCKGLDHYLGLDMGTTTDFLEKQCRTLAEKYNYLLSEKAGKTLISCLSSSIQIFVFCGFFIVAMFLLTKEIEPLRKKFRNGKHYPSLHLIHEKMKKSGFSYLKTEFLILILNWIICSFGVFLLHNPYFFLVGALIALLDALPIIGSGLFLIPWSILSIIKSDYPAAAILFFTFLITLFVREFLEARLLGKGMGINPFIMLLSIYVGMKLFGAAGIILGPLGSVLIQTFMAEA